MNRNSTSVIARIYISNAMESDFLYKEVTFKILRVKTSYSKMEVKMQVDFSDYRG